MDNFKPNQNNLKTVSCSQQQPETDRKGLGSRIRQSREAMKHSRTECAAAVEVSLSTFQAWETGDREPDATKLGIFARKYGISVNWLLFGEGAMLSTQSENFVPTALQTPHLCADVLGNPVDLEEFVFIPRYDLQASAGHGSSIDGEKPLFTMAFRRYWITNYLRTAPENLSVISVKGDSMEGVLNDRDVILIDRSDTEPSAGLYVLRIDGHMLVKRVQRVPGGKLKVVSANPAYEPFEVDMNHPTDDFAVLGRVVWFGRQVS